VVKAVNSVGEKDCTLALNFGGGAEDEENVPARYNFLLISNVYFTDLYNFTEFMSSHCFSSQTLQLLS
jgi:hypothetical protein